MKEREGFMENQLRRFSSNTAVLRFLLPIGLILIVFGVMLFNSTPDKYEETKGTVTNVTAHMNDDDEVYDIDFEYTVGTQKYSNTFVDMNEAKKVGDEIKVFYDPANPESVSNSKNTGIFGVAFIVIGAAAVAFSIYSTVKSFKKTRQMDEQIKATGGFSEMPEVIRLPKEQLTEYYISFDGHSLRPGYKMEDRNRTVVFDAPMTKNSLVTNRIFTFTNNLTGVSKEHEVGHTTTTSFNNEIFSVNSWFKFDGKNIWDVLHERGIRIQTDILSKFPKMIYTVSLNGQFLATVETSSKYVHEEDEEQHSIKIPFGKYYYRVWTNSTDLELLFLTVFAISETEQTVVE